MALHSQGFRFSKRVNKLEQQGKAYSNLGNSLDSHDGSQYKSVADTVLSANPKPPKRAKVKDTKTRPNDSANNRKDLNPHGVCPPSSNDDPPLKKFPPPPPTKLAKTSLLPPSSTPLAFADDPFLLTACIDDDFQLGSPQLFDFPHSSLQSRISSLVTKEPGPHYCSTFSSMNTEWTDPLLGSRPFGNIFDGYLVNAMDESCNFAGGERSIYQLARFCPIYNHPLVGPPLAFSLPLSAHPSRYSDLSRLYVLGHDENPEYPSVDIQPGDNPHNKLLFTTHQSCTRESLHTWVFNTRWMDRFVRRNVLQYPTLGREFTISTLLSDAFGFSDETDLRVISIIDTVKEATLNALTVYKNLASDPTIHNFESAYCIEKITFAMNFVITQIFTHLSTSTYGSPSQKLPTPPTSSGASPTNVVATLRLEIADLRAQLASKEREIQQLRQSETVQSAGLVGYAKDSADFILSQQRQDAMNYAKQPVVKTKIVGELFLSRKFFSSSVSWMIHSAMMHTLYHSDSPPTQTNLHVSQANGPHARGVSSITQDWFAVACLATLFKRNPRLAKQAKEDPGLANILWNGADAETGTGPVTRTVAQRKFYMESTFGGTCVLRFSLFQTQFGQKVKETIG